MGLQQIDTALKIFAMARIMEVFNKEVKIYAEQLGTTQATFLNYIYEHLDEKQKPVIGAIGRKVVEIFNERVKFHSTEYPSLSEATIKEAIRQHLSQ